MKSLGSMAALVLRLGAGAILLWAGIEKLKAFSWWRDQLEKTELLPWDVTGPVAAILPGMEVVIGAALILGCWLSSALIAGALLYAAFAATMFMLLRSGHLETCACFGPGSDFEITPQTVLLRGVIVVLLLWALADSKPLFTFDRRSD